MTIKDHNLTRLQYCENNDLDLVNDDVCTKFGLILSICSKDFEKKKTDSGLNQGP